MLTLLPNQTINNLFYVAESSKIFSQILINYSGRSRALTGGVVSRWFRKRKGELEVSKLKMLWENPIIEEIFGSGGRVFNGSRNPRQPPATPGNPGHPPWISHCIWFYKPWIRIIQTLDIAVHSFATDKRLGWWWDVQRDAGIMLIIISTLVYCLSLSLDYCILYGVLESLSTAIIL